MYRIRNRNKTL